MLDLASLEWGLSLKNGTGWGAWSCGQVSSGLTAASADRLCRRKERFEAVMAIGDPSTMQPGLRRCSGGWAAVHNAGEIEWKIDYQDNFGCVCVCE